MKLKPKECINNSCKNIFYVPDNKLHMMLICKQCVVGSTVTEITTRELKPFEFHCSKCNTIHKKSAYAIAQHAMGVRLVFTCTCGNKIDL